MRLLWIALCTPLAAYAGLMLYLFLIQERLLYFPDRPSRRVGATPAAVGLGFESLSLATEDGETLAAWFVPAAGARATVLYLHGNGGNIGHRVEMIGDFNDLGLNLLILDYRGYGESSGRPGEAGSYRDAVAAWRYLTEKRGIPAASIVLFGESMGGAIAAWLAERHQPGAVVLYAAFTSVADIARGYYPLLPVRLLLRLRYDTRAALARLDCPVLILHSSDDELVPFAHAEALYAAVRGAKELVALRGGHNDALSASRDRYRRALEDFLSKNLT